MEKKIQVTVADIQAKAEIIVINSYLVAKVVRANDTLDGIIERCKQPMTKWNKETEKHEPVLDEKGNPMFTYYDADCNAIQLVEERVYPLLKELLAAFGVEQQVL